MNITPLIVVKAIGRGKLADALRVGRPAISNALRQGVFPARWYRVVKSLADEAGVECPDSLFRWT
jgi:hypothetical protein